MKISICNFIVGCIFICNSTICQTKNEDLIRFKTDFTAESVKMSTLISKIRYIPLETNPECLIGSMNVPVFGKDIIICSYDGGGANIFRFSDQGKFINKIGKTGRGPEEYQDISDVTLIGDTVFVVSNFSNDIICYSLESNFLKKYHVETKSRPKSIIQLPEKSFMISLSNPSNLGIILKTDNEFNVEKGFIKNVPLDDNPLVNRFQRSKEKVFYYYNYLDTIFEISKGYPKPSFVMDYGQYKKSKEILSTNKKNNDVLNRPSIRNFSVGNSHYIIYVYYPFNYGTYTTIFRAFDGKQITWKKLINDIDNGVIDRWPGFLSGENMIFWLMPSTILERLGKMTDSEKADLKNLGFVEMASKIKPESNPVLMICKLK